MKLIRRGMGGVRGTAALCLATLAAPIGCATAHQDGTAPMAPGIVADALEIHDERLVPIVALLVDRSPRFRSALADLSGDAAPIRVHSYSTAPRNPEARRRYSYGYTLAYVDRRGGIDSVLVAVDLGRVREDAGALQVPEPDLRVELAVLLGHELFGHAIPLVDGGTVAGECADEPHGHISCSVERENLIRTDLGIPARASYRLIGLHVTRFRDRRILGVRVGIDEE